MKLESPEAEISPAEDQGLQAEEVKSVHAVPDASSPSALKEHLKELETLTADFMKYHEQIHQNY